MLFYEGVTNHHELAVAEGRKKGRKEGRKEGLAEGVVKGRAEGRAEGMASLMAKRFGGRVAEAGLPFIAGVSDPIVFEEIDEMLLESESGEEFLGRLENLGKLNGGG